MSAPIITARSASDALEQYTDALHWALNAFADNVFLVRSRFDRQVGAFALTPAGRDVLVLRDTYGTPRLALRVELFYQSPQLPGAPRRWTLRTVKYLYRLEDPANPARRFAAYHWHPEVPGIEFPHIHPLVAAGEDRRLHYATPHTTLKDVLTFAMRDFEVAPKRGDWQDALAAADDVLRRSLP